MPDDLNKFARYLQEQRKVSKNTCSSYLNDTGVFLNFLNTRNLNPLNVTTDVILQFATKLEQSGRSKSTILRNIASVRCYYRYLMQNGSIGYNPAKGFKVKHAERKLPEILTGQEIELLLSQPVTTEHKGCRDKSMLELLYATGIKVSELINLNIDDIDVKTGLLYIRRVKNERVIPVYKSACQAVADYINRVRIFLCDRENEALFTNMNGTRLTRQGFWKVVKQYTESANIKKTITPHTLRHSFAAHLLQNGAKFKDVQEMLGHSDISSTMVYADVIKHELTDIYTKYHPRAKYK